MCKSRDPFFLQALSLSSLHSLLAGISDSTFFLGVTTLLKLGQNLNILLKQFVNPTPEQNLVKLCSYKGYMYTLKMCIIHRKIMINFFSGSYAPFELRNKYTTETVCFRNTSKALNRIS